jgi:molybdopterin-guanine dinucleotide biosynthesis protein A
MLSAILMAGYSNKREVKKYGRIVAENYGQKFIESGYKPLREFNTLKDGKEERKPLIQYTLENLFASDLIDDIIIVGHQMLLEQRLGNLINKFEKPCCIVNQNSKIPSNVVERFNIIHTKVKQSSIAGNLIKGYAASSAFKDRKHALFVASDSPLTTKIFIEHFLNIMQKNQEPAAIVFPAVFIDDDRDKLGRYPLKLVNDTEYQLSDKKDGYDRQGFRLSSLMYANPHFFNINTVNAAYGLRKCLNPNVQLKLFRITRSLGYPNVYSKYFLKKDLSVKEVENIISEFFGGRVKLIPMIGEEATYDYDGTDSEYLMITDMLKVP